MRDIETHSVPAERVPLSLETSGPLELSPVRWRVITPDNVESVWTELAKSGNPVVLFAVTTDGYEQMAMDLAEIKRLIVEQRVIILKYKEYYEPQK